jgi:hypothetical protein
LVRLPASPPPSTYICGGGGSLNFRDWFKALFYSDWDFNSVSTTPGPTVLEGTLSEVDPYSGTYSRLGFPNSDIETIKSLNSVSETLNTILSNEVPTSTLSPEEPVQALFFKRNLYAKRSEYSSR